MTEWVNIHIWRRLVTVLIVAWVAFGGLEWLQSQHKVDTIQSGTINPDASVEEVLQQIEDNMVIVEQLPEFKPNNSQSINPNSQYENLVTGSQTIEIWAKDTRVVDNKSEQQNLDQMVKEVLSSDGQTNHEVAGDDYRERLTQLCQTYQSSCDITNLDGQYTAKQKFSYQLMVVYMINKLTNFWYDPLVTLRNLTINNYTKNKRWYANAKLMVLNTYQMRNNKEFLQVLAHEMGHVVDLWVVAGSSRQIDPNYTEFGKAKFAVDDRSLAFYAISRSNEDTMRGNMISLDFVSGYGMTNPFEDFAECHNMYQYHREVFAYLASTSMILQRKYDYFNDLYQAKYLSANFNPTDLTVLDIDVRVWDTTRM